MTGDSTGRVARTIAVVLAVATLSAAVVVGLGQSVPPRSTDADVTQGDRVRQMANESNASAPTGGFVSSVIGMEEANVDATVAISRFETRFSAARTEEARADAIATALNDSRMQVMMLERRLQTLEAKRANGSISDDWFAIEASWLLSSAENQGELAARLERAARTVPRDELVTRNASVDRIVRLQERIDRLLATERPTIHRTTFDRQFYRDMGRFVERFNESADASGFGTFGDLLDGERVTLHIESRTGPESVVSFRVTEDSRITDLRAGELADATVELRTDEETARRLVTADDPRRVLSRALRRGEIGIRGIGVVNALKWGVRGVVLAVFRILVDIVGGIADVF